MNALIESPKTHNGAVEQILDREGLDYSLQQLPHTVLEHTNDHTFQTRPSDDGKKITNDARVAQICESIENGFQLTAVVLFKQNGKYITCDGRHRLEAYRKCKFKGEFSAYVIDNLTEIEMHEIGYRLSDEFNRINGEQSGRDNQERRSRKVTTDNLATEIFNLFPNQLPTNEEINKRIKAWRLPVKSFSVTVKEKVYKKYLCLFGAQHYISKDEIDKFTQDVCEKIVRLISRTEPNQRKSLIDTLCAARKNHDSEIMMRTIKEHEQANSPISALILDLQNACHLNEDNTDKALPLRVSAAWLEKMTNICKAFLSCLSKPPKLFGDEKETAERIVKQAFDVISNSELLERQSS